MIQTKLSAKLRQIEIEELKREREIIATQNQNRKAWLITSISMSALLLFGILFILITLRQKNLFNKYLKIEVANKTNDLQALNRQLEKQYEELQRFNYVVSHDLKEPIRSIVSFSNILQKKIHDKDDIEYLDYVVNAGKQLYHLVDDIRDFQNIGQFKYEWIKIPLPELVDEICVALQLFLNERNATVVANDLPEIVSVKSALFIILKNLIENGVKYNENECPKVEITYSTSGNKDHIDITDNGIGIPEGYYEEVFVLFKRLNDRSKFEGSGIGLSICQKIAAKIGGEIQVLHSTIGEGTTFRLSIPQYVSSKNTPELSEIEGNLVQS